MMALEHFIVTRFNLKSSVWKESLDKKKVLTPEWHQHRLGIFLKYCYPSIRNQSNQNFTWYVFFDPKISSKTRGTLQKLEQEYPNFVPVYCKDIEHQKDELIKQIKRKVQDKQTFIVTTRLDNDDILHKDFIQTVQDAFQLKREKAVVDIISGYQLDISTNKNLLYYASFKGNPFISLGENLTELQTVLDRMHHDWGLDHRVITITKKRLWIQLIHGKNMSNKIPPYFFRAVNANFEDFGIEQISIEKSGARKPFVFLKTLISLVIYFFVRVKSKVLRIFTKLK